MAMGTGCEKHAPISDIRSALNNSGPGRLICTELILSQHFTEADSGGQDYMRVPPTNRIDDSDGRAQCTGYMACYLRRRQQSPFGWLSTSSHVRDDVSDSRTSSLRLRMRAKYMCRATEVDHRKRYGAVLSSSDVHRLPWHGRRGPRPRTVNLGQRHP